MATRVVDLGKVVGGPGPAGKSAYSAALDGGFVGTEEEFNAALAASSVYGGTLGEINGKLDAIKAKTDKGLISQIGALLHKDAGTYTLVNVTGAGIFHGGYLNGFADVVDVTIDGSNYGFQPASGKSYFGYAIGSPTLFGSVTDHTKLMDFHFKSSLKITFVGKQVTGGEQTPISANYSLYA